ncbi:hypothetical protein PRCB_22870 [Pantoea rodasii]|uniref:SnoaL-like domain-containing protein n=1 Tax=Pantoea rodasii TaxID=1076549 RepID=A0A2M9W5V0_9GAMM|nr:nuclear transport factor 2 family protein [Pantoea rodasii]ORM65355.1 hypothetical protein HA45_05405 [Pantoea rodasii]PJZ02923.1 hypothetical protein PRCB_22870 [Pantoea rodasii]
MSDITNEAVIKTFFNVAATAQDTSEIGKLVSPDIDWFIAGDTENVPWIGRKSGQTGAAEFYSQIREQIKSEDFSVDGFFSHGDRVLVPGRLSSRVIKTGKLIETDFIFDFIVKDGLITRFRLFEDSFAVSQASIV